MATYPAMTLTTAGQTLWSKVQAGATLTFTRMQIGGGQLASSATLGAQLTSGTAYTSLTLSAALTQAIANGSTIVIGTGGTTQTVTTSAYAAIGATTVSVTSFTANATYASGTALAITENDAGLTAVVTPVSYFNINSVTKSGTTTTVRGIFQNTNLSSTTYVCEIGLYAQDPDVGEILYAYANAGANGDNYPPYADGAWSAQIQLDFTVSNSTTVTANIQSNTYIPTSDIGAANGVASLDAGGQVPVSQLKNIPASNLYTNPQYWGA